MGPIGPVPLPKNLKMGNVTYGGGSLYYRLSVRSPFGLYIHVTIDKIKKSLDFYKKCPYPFFAYRYH